MLPIKIAHYLRLAESVAEMRAVFVFTDSEPNDEGRLFTEAEVNQLRDIINQALTISKTLDMPISRLLLDQKVSDIPRTGRELDMLKRVIYAELESKKFFFVQDRLAQYYDRSDTLSEKAAAAFPSCRSELIFSGNCLAFGEWTACVFHSMRAAEIGVRLLGQKLDVSFPDRPLHMAEWHQILDGVDAKVKAIGQRPKSDERDSDQLFYSQAAAEFRYFKDGWRVRVAHARAIYSESQALKLYSHVCDFFEVLSSRISELALLLD